MIIACIGEVLYAYFHYFVQPVRNGCEQDLAKIQALQEKIDHAEINLRGADSVVKEHTILRDELSLATNRFVIRPVLGSFLESARNLLEPIARQSEAQIEMCSERGRLEIPGNKKDGIANFDRYAVDVTIVGTYRAIREFVIAVERSNPYACVTDIDIQRRMDMVTHHKAIIRIEWPVFAEPTVAGRTSGPAGIDKKP
jgi:hypothetical protein